MPCYNQGEFIASAIDAVLIQDYDNFEIVIGDDGSTDDSKEIIQEYARNFPNLIVPLFNNVNLGINTNFNNILQNCKGKYIAFTAADDLFLQGKLKEQVRWMEKNSEHILCGHKVNWIDDSGKKIPHNSYTMESGSGPSEFIKKGPLYSSTSLMVRANKMPEIPFDKRIKWVWDWKLQIDILWDDEKYGFIDNHFAEYRRHSGNVSKNQKKIILFDQLKICGLVLIRSRGKYLLDCLFFLIYGIYRKIKKIL